MRAILADNHWLEYEDMDPSSVARLEVVPGMGHNLPAPLIPLFVPFINDFAASNRS
ncbi:MAG: hypothetical protein OEZ23_09320 [Gammaproteobacteria bacterium]|nr:hypothetical protein [Gammaproteobacteria bacterium]